MFEMDGYVWVVIDTDGVEVKHQMVALKPLLGDVRAKPPVFKKCLHKEGIRDSGDRQKKMNDGTDLEPELSPEGLRCKVDGIVSD
jgi:hypothetical protein